ncbi:MAG: sigma-70 family RNA polymerase sigma factor [Planctomycetes bacterium]|nr:sigma-70 family RNA polymerase sigma factor [Planctomycetota bacterium]
MPTADDETCWTLIRGAAAKRDSDREAFVTRYQPVVRAYLAARWSNSPLSSEIDDVVQAVFLTCLRDGGVLETANSQHPSGFRALLYGVSRNVARQAERTRDRRVRRIAEDSFDPDQTPIDEPTLSKSFDRAYAAAVMRDARDLMTRRALAGTDWERRRVELLRLRFDADLPIRDIARQWGIDAARLHREYERARNEFRRALADVVTRAEGVSNRRLEEECNRLLRLLRGT